MVIFKELIDKAIKNGYNEVNASAKVAQDVLLLIISQIEYNRNLTLKGGVLMRDFSKNARRATKDLDIDLIRYSLDDVSLIKLIEKMDGVENIEVKINGNIKELKQQDYKGKRVSLSLKDNNGQIIPTKIDFGVHADLTIEQISYCIDVGVDDNGVIILANTIEQMMTEKICSLLKHRIATTRYKDIFDICYLTDYVDNKKIVETINKIILKNEGVRENTIDDISKSLKGIFANQNFVELIRNSKDNWIEKDVDEVIVKIEKFVDSLL